MAKALIALVMAAMGALALVACEGGGGGGGGGGRAATSATTTPTFAGSAGDAASGWCAYANQVQGTTALNGSFQKDPEAWVAQVTALMAQAEAAAPAAISGDVATMAGGVRGLAEALTANHDDFSRLSQQQLAGLEDPGFVAAGQRVRAYDQQVCHSPN